ncbi:class II aaRS and biotin synthetase [Clavulina sp. PMI_390]|nr:class II aaRS and biotin synthetase [Clavulina sp. PMI_390]
MNILVYDGPGVSKTSLSHTLYTLKRHLGTRYAVQTVSAEVLKSHPWATTCALLVMPGGRDVPYLDSLSPNGTKNIRSYVKHGGSYLGLCAGAYFGSSRIEWEKGTKQEVVGDRPLGFYPGTCEGCVYKGFEYNSEAGARAITLQPLDALTDEIEPLEGIYYNGGGHFVDADKKTEEGVSPLLRYVGGDNEGKVAAVLCKFAKGVAILSSVHIEYPLFFEPAASALKRAHPSLSNTNKSLMENTRSAMMASMLSLLHLTNPVLNVNPTTKQPSPTIPLPQILVCNSLHTEAATKFLERLPKQHTASLVGGEYILVGDQTDTFHVAGLLQADLKRYMQKAREIAVVTDTELPDSSSTPLFDIGRFFKEVENYRDKTFRWKKEQRLGDVLLYGEVVTSTQSLLDRNPTILRELPAPLVSLATFQLSGKGRGGNVWVSPSGSLLCSFTVRPPPSRDTRNALPNSSLVFVQYLAGLAVAETCREILQPPNATEENEGEGDQVAEEKRRAGERIRLKWPNDIYSVKGTTDMANGLKKVGGVIVSTNFSGGEVDVTVGVGLNVLNDYPTTSLAQLAAPGVTLSIERTAAVLSCIFDRMWEEFVENKGSFEPFMDLYLERWLHSDQLVSLTTVSPPIQVRLTGITSDYGMLRAVRAYNPSQAPAQRYGQPEIIDLQPDGNSFDMFEGMIKLKK